MKWVGITLDATTMEWNLLCSGEIWRESLLTTVHWGCGLKDARPITSRTNIPHLKRHKILLKLTGCGKGDKINNQHIDLKPFFGTCLNISVWVKGIRVTQPRARLIDHHSSLISSRTTTEDLDKVSEQRRETAVFQWRLQGSRIRLVRGLVNFVPALA